MGFGFNSSASAGVKTDCAQAMDPDLQANSCSTIIRSGKWSGKHLAVAYNNRGAAHYNLGKYIKAIEDYSEALKLNPNYAEAYNNRGYIYDDLQEPENAFKDYNQAIKLNSKYAEAFLNRGYLDWVVEAVKRCR